MKQAIIGYITALINRHERITSELHDINVNSNEVRKCKNFKDELSDLLDYVVDLEEESQEPIKIDLGNIEQIEALKKRIRELQEVYASNSEVIGAQFKKIQELKDKLESSEQEIKVLEERLRIRTILKGEI